jgi:nitrite reductase (NO-forming)
MSYLTHRGVHMTLNVFGWAGMTIVGTAITLLPTILHVRAPSLKIIRPVPWLMFGGLMLMSAGATTGNDWIAAGGMAAYVTGLVTTGFYFKTMIATPRRRRIPTAAFHLMCAIAWAFVTAAALIFTTSQGDTGASRDLVVVGGAAGFALQALLGAWSFLLPSTRAPVPTQRRAELTAMELGGRAQVIGYNVGLIAIFWGLRTGMDDVSLVGIVVAWLATAWALTKSWSFSALAALPRVQRLSESWWTDPTKERANATNR